MESLKVLVSGASGFCGANAVKHFSKNNEVFGITRSKGLNWRLKDIQCDFTNVVLDLAANSRERIIDTVKAIKPDVLLHMACYDYHLEADVSGTIKTNIIGSMSLLDACKGSMIINTGTSLEYGIRDAPMKETDPIAPTNNHAISKAIMTNLCASQRIPTLRLFSVYGYYEINRLIPNMIYSALSKRKATLTGPGYVRDFVFIDDVINAYELMVDRYNVVNNYIFNIGSGRQQTLNEVAGLVGSEIEWDAASRPKEPKRMWQADITRAKGELGWKPRYSLKEGIEKTKEWMSKRIDLYGSHKIADKLRGELIAAHKRYQFPHIGSEFSALDIMIALYFELMQKEDRFVLSKGHAGFGLYAVMHEKGLISDDDYWSMGQNGSLLAEHTTYPDYMVKNGSLGNGIAIGAGMALAKQLSNEKGKVYVLCSDGEMQEGNTYEGMHQASRFKLGNLVVIIDNNRWQCYDRTEDILSISRVGKVFKENGWLVDTVDGHDYESIRGISKHADSASPVCIIANTVLGKGIPEYEDKLISHYRPPP